MLAYGAYKQTYSTHVLLSYVGIESLQDKTHRLAV